MHLNALTILPFLHLILANPLPVPEPEPQDGSVSSLPGVNITNGNLAGTADVVKNSYIVVYKDDASDSTVDQYQKKVGNRIGGGLKNTFRIKSTESGKAGFSAAQVVTDKAGLEAIAKDPLVSYFIDINSDIFIWDKIDKSHRSHS